MLKTAVFLVACLPLCGGSVLAEETAPITRVVLYPGSASVERTAQVVSGMRQLEVRGLPGNFDTKTLQVQADPGIRIGQVVIRDADQAAAVHPREKELKKKIVGLKDQIEALDNEVKSAELVTGYFARLGGGVGERGGADGRTLSGLAESMEASALRAFQRAQRAEIRKRQYREDLEQAEFELAQFQSGARGTRGLSVQLAVERAGQIRLSYQVMRAGWQPAYRAALDSARAVVELERLAQVSQKTGEDWVGVSLVLSTGQPQAFREPVEPATRHLVYLRPQDSSMARAAPLMAAAPAAKAVALRQEADYVAPVIETLGAFVTEFEVPGKVTLPADGREIAVSLGQQAYAAAQHVQVTPALSKSAVLVAEFERAPGVWLPGNIQLYRDGSYVGASRWNPAANERFTLSFGSDELLYVSVDHSTRFDGQSGIVGQHRQRQVADTYTLSSRHHNAIELLVLEPSPVSQSQEIEVTRSFRPAPSGENWKARPGVVFWNKTLAPDERWSIDVGYTISYPREGSVSGLP